MGIAGKLSVGELKDPVRKRRGIKGLSLSKRVKARDKQKRQEKVSNMRGEKKVYMKKGKGRKGLSGERGKRGRIPKTPKSVDKMGCEGHAKKELL